MIQQRFDKLTHLQHDDITPHLKNLLEQVRKSLPSEAVQFLAQVGVGQISKAIDFNGDGPGT